MDFIFNSPKYVFVFPVLRKNRLYQVSSTVTFCNGISIMPFLILEMTCKQQAYRKAYWPSPNVVYFPVRVYSRTLSGTHRCPPRMTLRETDIVSVPEWLSIYGLLFASFIICRVSLHLDFVPDMSSMWPNLGPDPSNATLPFFSFTYSQPACLESFLKYLNGWPAIWVREISACINSCGFYKQLTWSLSKSPLNSPPSSHPHIPFSVFPSLCLIKSFILFTGSPRLDLKIRYAKWEPKRDILFFHWFFGLADCCVKSSKTQVFELWVLAEVASFIVTHYRAFSSQKCWPTY